jgi:transcriptional regulator with XRE-family HTH domain
MARSFHDRRLAKRLEDPDFRGQFDRALREIRTIDSIVNELDSLRARAGISKAELARRIEKNPASVRRLLTAPANPELRTVIAIADALGAEIRVVPRDNRHARASSAARSSSSSRSKTSARSRSAGPGSARSSRSSRSGLSRAKSSASSRPTKSSRSRRAKAAPG